MRRNSFAALSLTIGLSALAAQSPAPPPKARVLFIGNSYTYYNDLPAIFLALAEDGRRSLEVRMAAPGGWRLKDHWERGEARKALHDSRWDYVVLQDQSTLGVNLYVDGKTRVDGDEVFRPYAEKWAQEVRKSGATPVFYLTWAPRDSPEDQDRLTYAYMTAASESRALVAPVGLAWQEMREKHPEIDLFQKEGSHPSAAGSYLVGCVLFSTLFGKSPEGLTARISGNPINLDTEKIEEDKTDVLVDLKADIARTLQSAAWSAWQKLKERGGYLSFPEPAPPAPAPIPGGVNLSAVPLEGTWKGEFKFHPSGPILMTLQLQRVKAGWAGRLLLDYRPDDVADESADLERIEITDRAVTFAFPSSPAVNGLRIDFRGVAIGPEELRGTAEASKNSEQGLLRLLGSWRVRRE